MRPGQQNKRGRGRGGNNPNNNNSGNRKGQNPLSRTYDSSGPDVKIRGTAQHVAEKYMNLARDAQSSGDRVMAENYLQHAEHYNRIILTAQAQMQERFQRDDNSPQGRDSQDQDDDDRDTDDDNDNTSYDPRGDRNDQQARSERQPQQDRGDRTERQERGERNERPDRGERSERRERPARPEQQSKPAFDADAPQPVIEGIPAEVAGSQETQDTDAAPRVAPRRRGRPKRVRSEDAADTGSAGDSPASAEPVTAD
ncbi:MAG: DUF4167 domain-containing protein [Hoeflea sp.]|uniref:DUF4167 domain-containing protein n=1 Tax=Hoeflea sp. TaxID=1940281 RepID=UPI001D2479D6|nr:DUF4167 domain-containing protein [Hoeflea sp.]MBU4528698.1 DUF4167 domain-containing protein [Alphaproteobacteria bacterium]MBU4545497.1 DUF4167 domain-containing protein [Alphaproteobacteria bacterium]MBU4552107.1 DUF4167 domain-containing protein [Alphaproteobacteria bacterium]MBV1726301.1 DUF4167 domain-containing protein [Hoeflea sp.]MBV1762272.1 DUF4167 domain-containing protein [Hoeflea sp.]